MTSHTHTHTHTLSLSRLSSLLSTVMPHVDTNATSFALLTFAAPHAPLNLLMQYVASSVSKIRCASNVFPSSSNATDVIQAATLNAACDGTQILTAFLTALGRIFLSFPLHAVCGGMSGVALYLLAKPRDERRGFCSCPQFCARCCTTLCGAKVTCSCFPLGFLSFLLCYFGAIFTHGLFDFYLFSLGSFTATLPVSAGLVLNYGGTIVILLLGIAIFSVMLCASGVLEHPDFPLSTDEDTDFGLTHLRLPTHHDGATSSRSFVVDMTQQQPEQVATFSSSTTPTTRTTAQVIANDIEVL